MILFMAQDQTVSELLRRGRDARTADAAKALISRTGSVQKLDRASHPALLATVRPRKRPPCKLAYSPTMAQASQAGVKNVLYACNAYVMHYGMHTKYGVLKNAV